MTPRDKSKTFIIVQLKSLELKINILKRKRELAKKPYLSNVYVNRKLTSTESKVFRCIRELAGKAKKDNKPVKFNTRDLSIDNVEYRWDYIMERMVPVTPISTVSQSSDANMDCDGESQNLEEKN